MIYEILLPIPIRKTFYYEGPDTSNNQNNNYLGKLVEVDFKNKKIVGLIVNTTEKKIQQPLKKIIRIIEYFIFQKEVLESLRFISRYSCNNAAMILKLFLSNLPKRNDFNKEYLLTKSHKSANLNLNSGQKDVVNNISNINFQKFNVILLEGITGSGKTRVYMTKVKEVVDRGFQCLILVPEIILTNQWVNEIKKDFGLNPVIYHSSIKKSQRENIWSSINKNKLKLVVGTRSALFLPFVNLGLLVVDEEHDSSYKQEEQIIINARDFSIVRAKNSNCMVILSSATPSLESYYNVNLKKFWHFKLNERVNNSDLPEIKIIDMKKEKEIISKELKESIQDNLKENYQTLLFINKRGYASFVICKSCGFSKTCKNCHSSLVLHNYKEKSYLLCHHCNYKEFFENKCPSCKTKNSMSLAGTGVEKVSELISELFPNASTTILSSDSVKNARAFKDIISKIISNKINIIIGTQLISKGHHFPSLKTVGIINIDNVLNDFDFRSSEKTFQQVTQVAGRAGRKNLKGEVFIQTLQPTHPVIELCKFQNVKKFVDSELGNRKKNMQPPFVTYISIIFSSKTEKYVKNFSSSYSKLLQNKFKNISIFGPAPAILYKKNLNYRYRILIKMKKENEIQGIVKNYLIKIKIPPPIKLFIDVDPINFI